ncbi:MAG TPA: hypothetical protein VIV11_32655 [Kofleriaceae bacterium]
MLLLTRKRLAWLATCALFVACASAPDPKPSKKKKKKRNKDSIALKKKKDAERDNDDDKPRKKAEPENEAEDKPKKEPKEDEDAVTISDDTEDEKDTPAKKKPAKKPKKKTDEPKDEDASEVAAKPKKKKDKEQPKDEDVEEVAAKPKKKKDEPIKVAAKDKKKKADADEEAEIEIDEPPDEPEPTKVASKTRPKTKGKKDKAADVDMTSPPDEEVIEMGEEPERVEDQPPDRRGVAIPVPGVDSEEDTPPEEATPIGSNPLAINERPLVLGKSKLAVHGGLRVNVLTLETMPGVTTSSTATGLALGATYGIGDSSEVGLDYTAGISPGSAKGPLTIHGAYSASTSAKLDIAIAAAAAIDFSGSTDPVTMQTTTSTSLSLQFGAWARYRLSRKMSVFTGLPATPNNASSLSKLSFPLPPLPYQLVIGVNQKGTIALDIPLGVGYQGTPKLYVFGALDLAHIRVANTENAFLFADFIPLTLGGFYAMNKLDLGAQFSDDLKQGFDYLRFDVLVRYSIK